MTYELDSGLVVDVVSGSSRLDGVGAAYRFEVDEKAYSHRHTSNNE